MGVRWGVDGCCEVFEKLCFENFRKIDLNMKEASKSLALPAVGCYLSETVTRNPVINHDQIPFTFLEDLYAVSTLWIICLQTRTNRYRWETIFNIQAKFEYSTEFYKKSK